MQPAAAVVYMCRNDSDVMVIVDVVTVVPEPADGFSYWKYVIWFAEPSGKRPPLPV